jgi:LPXTG-site transpeptidase (sortase) family protein
MAINTPSEPPDFSQPQDPTAADLVRQKVARVYGDEPVATQELAEAEAVPRRSKHQQFMYELGQSGKDLATIQTEWHNYYQNLSPLEKHRVWQEFYESQSAVTGQVVHPQAVAEHKHQAAGGSRAKPKKLRDARSAKEVQSAIRDTVTAGGQLETRHHLQSLLFGLGMGLIVVLIFLFGFFNEVIIAPFIQPSRAAASTPLIIGNDSVPPSSTPEVIIPKINVEIPVDYTQTSTQESTIENALEGGIVHYPTTVKPGEAGNAAFFGHSSNNIFNKGKYKFAFVLLHTLVQGDTFYLSYNGKLYVYKVISKTVVEPNNVGVLNAVPGQTATATLITCDPPGTSLHRLVVVGQQISPDPSGNTTASAPVATTGVSPQNLPGNGPTLGGRFIRTTIGKVVTLGGLTILFLLVVRWLNRGLTRLVT